MTYEGAMLRALVLPALLGIWQVITTLAACILSWCWSINELDQWIPAIVGPIVALVLLTRGSPRWAAVASLVGASYAESIAVDAGSSVSPIGPLLVPVLWAIAATSPRSLRSPMCRAVSLLFCSVSLLIAAPAVMGVRPHDWASTGALGLLAVVANACCYRASPRHAVAIVAVAPVGLHLALHLIAGYGAATSAWAPVVFNSWAAVGLAALLFTPADPDLPRLVITGESDNGSRRNPAPRKDHGRGSGGKAAQRRGERMAARQVRPYG